MFYNKYFPYNKNDFFHNYYISYYFDRKLFKDFSFDRKDFLFYKNIIKNSFLSVDKKSKKARSNSLIFKLYNLFIMVGLIILYLISFIIKDIYSL